MLLGSGLGTDGEGVCEKEAKWQLDKWLEPRCLLMSSRFGAAGIVGIRAHFGLWKDVFEKLEKFSECVCKI